MYVGECLRQWKMLIVEGQAHQLHSPIEGVKGKEEARMGQRRVDETKEKREVDPRSMPRNNSEEHPGPLPSLRGERPQCWTPASLVGFLLRHAASGGQGWSCREMTVCVDMNECVSFTLADEVLAEHPNPLSL